MNIPGKIRLSWSHKSIRKANAEVTNPGNREVCAQKSSDDIVRHVGLVS